MNLRNWTKQQQEYIDAFKLECSDEDLIDNDYAKQFLKGLKRQCKITHKITKLLHKMENGNYG